MCIMDETIDDYMWSSEENKYIPKDIHEESVGTNSYKVMRRFIAIHCPDNCYICCDSIGEVVDFLHEMWTDRQSHIDDFLVFYRNKRIKVKYTSVTKPIFNLEFDRKES